jgi:hypothetical protein
LIRVSEVRALRRDEAERQGIWGGIHRNARYEPLARRSLNNESQPGCLAVMRAIGSGFELLPLGAAQIARPHCRQKIEASNRSGNSKAGLLGNFLHQCEQVAKCAAQAVVRFGLHEKAALLLLCVAKRCVTRCPAL